MNNEAPQSGRVVPTLSPDWVDAARLMREWGSPDAAAPWGSAKYQMAGLGSYPLGRQPGVDASLLDERRVPAAQQGAPRSWPVTRAQERGRAALLCGFVLGVLRWSRDPTIRAGTPQDPYRSGKLIALAHAPTCDAPGCYVGNLDAIPVDASSIHSAGFERHAHSVMAYLPPGAVAPACYPAPTVFDQAASCVMVNTLAQRHGFAAALEALNPACIAPILALGQRVAARLRDGAPSVDDAHEALAALAREHLAELLQRYPVLLHPRLLYVDPGMSSTGTHSAAAPLLSLMMASEGLSLPCRRMGFTQDEVVAFASNPWVLRSLCGPLEAAPNPLLAPPPYLETEVPLLCSDEEHLTGRTNTDNPAYALLHSLVELDGAIAQGPLPEHVTCSLYRAAGRLPSPHTLAQRAPAVDALMSLPFTSLLGNDRLARAMGGNALPSLLVGRGISRDQADMPLSKAAAALLAAFDLTHAALEGEHVANPGASTARSPGPNSNPFHAQDRAAFCSAVREVALLPILLTHPLVQPIRANMGELVYNHHDLRRLLAGPPPEASALIRARLQRFIALLSDLQPALTGRQMIRICAALACRACVDFDPAADDVGGLVDGAGPNQPHLPYLRSPPASFETTSDSGCRKAFIEIFLSCLQAIGHDLAGAQFDLVSELSPAPLAAWMAGRESGFFSSAAPPREHPREPSLNETVGHLAEWHEVVSALKTRQVIVSGMAGQKPISTPPRRTPPRRI